MIDIKVKYIACSLASSILTYINENFESVSFQITTGNRVDLKFILKKRTALEEELINSDILCDYDVLLSNPQIQAIFPDTSVLIEVGKDKEPFEHIVYSRDDY